MRRAPFPNWRPRRDPELPYRVEWKEVHGQLVPVKVYRASAGRLPLGLDAKKQSARYHRGSLR